MTEKPDSPEQPAEAGEKAEEAQADKKKDAQKDGSANPFEQLQEMLKNADIQFVPFGGAPGQQQQQQEAPSPGKDESAGEAEEIIKRIKSFNLRPREVRDYLDRFVIKQDEAKKVLSVAICDHYNYVRECIENPDLAEREHAKSNIILMGPTGVGKTYLMRCIARLIGVPFVKADATKFSETGYVGYDVEDIVRDLVKLAGGNTELAQYGIIYIDEIDKIASQGQHGGKDVSGRGVQVNLLKLMEETDVNLFSQTDILGQMRAIMDMQRGRKQKRTINTRHMLFIVSGAFDSLAERVKKRIEKTAIGFVPDVSSIGKDPNEYLARTATRDFIDYGYEPEFIGRLPVRVACEHLDKTDLEKVLTKSEDSLLDQYQNDFEGYGIKLDVAPEAISTIAERASKEKTGARGLVTVMESIFRDFKFELPSTTVDRFTLTGEAVENPAEALAGILEERKHEQDERWRKDAVQYAEQLGRDDGFTITVEEDAIDLIVARSKENDRTVRGYCEERFKDLLYGLKLIAQRSDRREFVITRHLVEDPDKTISDWVVENYKDDVSKGGEKA